MNPQNSNEKFSDNIDFCFLSETKFLTSYSPVVNILDALMRCHYENMHSAFKII